MFLKFSRAGESCDSAGSNSEGNFDKSQCTGWSENEVAFSGIQAGRATSTLLPTSEEDIEDENGGKFETSSIGEAIPVSAWVLAVSSGAAIAMLNRAMNIISLALLVKLVALDNTTHGVAVGTPKKGGP